MLLSQIISEFSFNDLNPYVYEDVIKYMDIRDQFLATSTDDYLDTSYHGSRLFKPLDETIGFQIDRVRFCLFLVV